MVAFNKKNGLLICMLILFISASFWFLSRYLHLDKTSSELALTLKSVENPVLPLSPETSRLLNEYQIAQLQRLIAENNEAIALAKRSAAQATADTLKLLGMASAVPEKINSETKSTIKNSNYELVYTGQQNDGNWTATLKKNGKNYEVTVGKRLVDGSQVSAIDEAGVLLTRDNNANKELITFSGEISSQ